MSEHNGPQSPSASYGTRKVEIVTALCILVLGGLAVFDAIRVGYGWEQDGPQAGFYPFYVGVFLSLAALSVLLQQFMHRREPDAVFLESGQLVHVLAVLLPSCVYVGAIYILGIYVSSALFLFLFTTWQGKYGLMKSLPISLIPPFLIFMLFEIWFKIPLPKGPLETWLGW